MRKKFTGNWAWMLEKIELELLERKKDLNWLAVSRKISEFCPLCKLSSISLFLSFNLISLRINIMKSVLFDEIIIDDISCSNELLNSNLIKGILLETQISWLWFFNRDLRTFQLNGPFNATILSRSPTE